MRRRRSCVSGKIWVLLRNVINGLIRSLRLWPRRNLQHAQLRANGLQLLGRELLGFQK
jgi:hypothetical protein